MWVWASIRPRQHRGAAQIDDASARRRLNLNLPAGAHFGDAVTSNDHDLIRHHAALGLSNSCPARTATAWLALTSCDVEAPELRLPRYRNSSGVPPARAERAPKLFSARVLGSSRRIPSGH